MKIADHCSAAFCKRSYYLVQTAPEPDLIFSDIQPGDGLSFEIFLVQPVSTPVIFCTDYVEYALERLTGSIIF
ncbi:hypothetical protein [Chitinophaga sp.]|uniref:hypothetical protein n=1 Tax=Chitinophaga sp. TaxID=1869181 RepID=UPI002F945FC3